MFKKTHDHTFVKRLNAYVRLMRLHQPIGIVLLLWPTLWALWLASSGHPQLKNLVIFIVGVFIMRSAGCIINDLFDQDLDPYVERTKSRPLANKEITPKAALLLLLVLLSIAFLLVLQCNALTIALSFVAAGLAACYPYLKRITYLPQVGLGIAFSFSVPMAFAAELNHVGANAWLLFGTAFIWPIIYDTMYALVDKADDLKIGIKSTAILFGRYTRQILFILQIFFVGLLGLVGVTFHLAYPYFLSLPLIGLLFLYQQWLIKNYDRMHSFRAFLNNQWVGLILFIAIILSVTS